MTQKNETKELEVVRSQVDKAFATAESLTIRSDSDYEGANVYLQKLRGVEKMVEQGKRKQLDPANATVKAIREFWKPFEDRISEAKAIANKAILSYKQKLDARLAQREATISQKVESGEISFSKAVEKVEQIQAVPTTYAGVKTRKIPKVEFSQLESLKPNEIATLVTGGFIVWDEVKARAYVVAGQKTGQSLPGTRYYEEVIIG